MAYSAAIRRGVEFFGAGATLAQINTRKSLLEFQAHIAAKNSARTANYYPVILRQILKEAVKHGHLTEVAKIERVRDHRPKKVKEPFTLLELDKLLEAAYAVDPLMGTMIETAAKTGLRFGEMAALRWSDLNWGQRRIMVGGSVYCGQVTAPKARRLNDWIPMSAACFDTLQSLFQEQRSDQVFPNTQLGLIDYHNFYRRKYVPLLHSVGLYHKRGWRNLRHTFATILIREGINIKDLGRLMRHSDCKITLETYSHFYEDRLAGTIQAIDKVGVSKQLPLRLVKGSTE